MAFRKKTVRDIDLAGKIVLMRVDYNVPMKEGRITNDARIEGSLPTINYILEQGAEKLILMSHMGRPEGQYVPELSLKPCKERLVELLPGREVRFSDMIYGPDAKAAVDALPKGGVLLLENLRFLPEEEENSEKLAQELIDATGAELFVQDGFAVVHRAHASTDAIAHLLPAVAGFLVEKEVSSLEKTISDPERPLLVIVGGAKVADKEPLIGNFEPIADMIAVGGKIAADGYKSDSKKIYVAEDFVNDDEGAMRDIGAKSTAKIVEMISKAQTVVWNGTLGVIENEQYAKASRAIATAMGKSKAMTVVCGGDTAGFAENLAKADKTLSFDLISTGGGASLELLCGEKLPGVEVLQDK